ncbi:MAG: type II toxin-antitoxin system VapC family toxin, partial [Bradyrhizobium sp.]
MFVDANCLVYHFGPDPVLGPPCRELMKRIDRQDIHAFTSSHILSDVGHRLMTIEAMTRLSWPAAAGIVQRLRRHPADIQQFTDFRAAVESIHNSKMQILSVASDQVVAAASLSQQFGLLSGDALI